VKITTKIIKNKMELAILFEIKLHSIEQRNCLACNYTMQSQKGHTCWEWYRSVIDDDKLMYKQAALDELEAEGKIDKSERFILDNNFCNKSIFSEEDKEVEYILKNAENIVSGLRNLC
jgi:hypothetical protein